MEGNVSDERIAEIEVRVDCLQRAVDELAIDELRRQIRALEQLAADYKRSPLLMSIT